MLTKLNKHSTPCYSTTSTSSILLTEYRTTTTTLITEGKTVRIYQNVKAVARKQKITIAELEKRAGLGNGTIQRWKKFNPRIENLNKVAEALDIPVINLLR